MNRDLNCAQSLPVHDHNYTEKSDKKRNSGRTPERKRKVRLSTVILSIIIVILAAALCVSGFVIVKLQRINLFSKSIILSNNYFLENSGYGMFDDEEEDGESGLSNYEYKNPEVEDYGVDFGGILYIPGTEEVDWMAYSGVSGADDELQNKIYSWIGNIRTMYGGNYDYAPWVYRNMAEELYHLYTSGTREIEAVKEVCGMFCVDFESTKFTPVDAPKTKQLDVPYLSQEGILPNGCESVSATMLLNYWGIDITPEDFVDKYLYCENVSIRWGVRYGPNPKYAYAGDPRSEKEGWGCFAPVIVRALNGIVPEGLAVKNLTGITLSKLKDYIDRDIPVAVWVTVDMGEVEKILQWQSKDGEETFLYPANEHCMVLVGYDDDGYIFADPYGSNGIVKYSAEECLLAFNSLGRQAVAIVKR